jgi:hypothetical protein
VSRLQFYRRAYGRINDDGEADLSEQKKIAEDFFAGSKLTLDWPDMHTAASGVSVSYKLSRLILNLLIIISATLLRGGTLSVRITADDSSKELRINATGVAIKWDKDIEEVLLGKVALENLVPKTVQAELTRMLTQEIGATLSWQVTDKTVELVLRQPVADKA